MQSYRHADERIMDYLNTDFGVDSSIRFLFRARTDAQSGYKSLSQRILSGGVLK